MPLPLLEPISGSLAWALIENGPVWVGTGGAIVGETTGP
jgi:hypothetical protein